MKLLSLLAKVFSATPPRMHCTVPAETQHQRTRKTRAIWLLIRQGTITTGELAKMGDTSPTKTIVRMRRDGVLYAEHADPAGFKLRDNASGQGQHKVYKWTGHVPAALERRSKPRGGK